MRKKEYLITFFYEKDGKKNIGTTVFEMKKPSKDIIRELEKYLIGRLRNIDRLVIINFQELERS